MVDGEIGASRWSLRPALHDHDLGPLAESRQEQRCVVGDPRALGRHRGEERDLHASSLPIARSQVTSSASRLPASPHRRGLVDVVAQPRYCVRDGARLRGDDEPRLTVEDDVERPTRVGCGDHGLLREEALVRPHPEVLVDRRVVDRAAACVEIGEALGG